MTKQSEMDIALDLVRRAAMREATYPYPMITTFMGYTPEQILAMRGALDKIIAEPRDDAAPWMRGVAREALKATPKTDNELASTPRGIL